MIATRMNTRRGIASPAAISRTFTEYRAELEWLAYVITADENVAAACVTDACAIAVSHNEIFQEWLLNWARQATIRSALQTQHLRVLQLSSVYEQHTCVHGSHKPLGSELVDLAVRHSNVLVTKLDLISRCALVMCGIEKYSTTTAALLLGVRKSVVEAAYCAALESLDAIMTDQFSSMQAVGALCN